MQGLSHYLEHMLFMGSEKYPDENEYDSYLTKHGGSSNAFTELVRRLAACTCNGDSNRTVQLFGHKRRRFFSADYSVSWGPHMLPIICGQSCICISPS